MSVELDYKIGQLQYEISILGLDEEELTGVTKRTEELKDLVKNLSINGVVKSLPIQDLPNCTRVEVIDQKGRSYVNWKPTNKVRLSMQDDGKTAKIFID